MKSYKSILPDSMLIPATALASLLPLVFHALSFQQLYYFHDDWLMLDRAERLPLWRWLFQPFLGESVIPVFKGLWLAAVGLSGGSYFALICLQWATHLLICVLFGTLLARFRMSPAATAFAVLTFGLAWSNIETLGWFMQWGSQLALLFFLAAWHWLLEIQEGRRGLPGLALLLIAGALSSSRGILSGLILAVFALLAGRRTKGSAVLYAVLLAPAAVMTLITWLVLGNRVGAIHASAVFSYGMHSLLLNPLYHLITLPHQAVNTLALCVYGPLNAAVMAAALWKADTRQRLLLWVLLALDVANAAALGFARSYTPLDTSVSSRYQYVPLLCFGPMAGLLVGGTRRFARAALFLLWVPLLVVPWQRHAPRWAGWRGTEIRNGLRDLPDGAHFDPSSLTAGRARELAKLYHLH